jgi:hypothetical protein
MKKAYIYLFIPGLIISIFYSSCEPLDIKRRTIVNTGQIINDSVSYSSAVVQGLVIDVSENQPVIGHCWNESGMPTIEDVLVQHETNDLITAGYGYFTKMTNLSPGRTYFVRAYAQEGSNVVYGEEISFATTENPNWTIEFDFPSSSGNSLWPIGTEATISWITDALGEFKVELYKQGTSDFVKIYDIGTTKMHQITYTLPNELTAGTYYYIKVENITYPELGVYNFSSSFKATIPSITVNKPALNDIFFIGRPNIISWTSNDVDFVDITLYKGGVEERKIAEGQTNTGSYEWNVDEYNSPPVVGTDYSIKVRYTAYPEFENYSSNFEIVLPQINITAPTQGEALTNGTAYTIKWTSNLPQTENVIIELYNTNDTFEQEIAAPTENDGQYVWTPNITGNYLLRISSYDYTNPQSLDVAITIN